MAYDDDDDWVGTPPEGRISRDRAKPEHWQRSFPVAQAFFAILGILVVVVLVLALT
jgi:hypothetical protein